MKKRKCPNCKQKSLTEEYEDCCRCGGGIVWVCTNKDCCALFDEKLEEI
jgi:hypothetical protein